MSLSFIKKGIQMKKIILGLIISTSLFANVEPTFSVSINNKNAIVINVSNPSENDISCDWAETHFENVLTYKRNFGSFKMAGLANTEINITNDLYAKLKKVNVKFECE
jgi:hypothetical protein